MFEIDEFNAEKGIDGLPTYPVEFFVDGITDGPNKEGSAKSSLPVLQKTLRSRAESFWKYCACTKGSQLFKYIGSALILGILAEGPPATYGMARTIFGTQSREQIATLESTSPRDKCTRQEHVKIADVAQKKIWA